jgi:hypothetical protein
MDETVNGTLDANIVEKTLREIFDELKGEIEVATHDLEALPQALQNLPQASDFETFVGMNNVTSTTTPHENQGNRLLAGDPIGKSDAIAQSTDGEFDLLAGHVSIA